MSLGYELSSEPLHISAVRPYLATLMSLRILVHSVIYVSGWVSLEHLLLSRYPSSVVDIEVYYTMRPFQINPGTEVD